MRVAFATTDGSMINEHFGRSAMFSIYEIGPDGYDFVETRVFGSGSDKRVEDTKGMGQLHDEAVQDKVESLSDCKILYVTEIGGPSAARLVSHNMMPVKVKSEVKIDDILKELLERIKSSPPPWLRKALQTGSGDSQP
ncbi:MAG: nitrogen fixation protein NifX [Nitrospirae bacterium]|nr:nitrogen fixation protein NifX [Nitrospirota bacterium]MBF0591124.1 nitrogen fixation protein NifX [Nitrospirota bacterium]